jgi:hemerythrin-like domain-containing protein
VHACSITAAGLPRHPLNAGCHLDWAGDSLTCMTTSPTSSRVDLFTDIHKALRVALFDVSAAAGATDWDVPEAVTSLAAQWQPLVELLRAHTEHENDYIFRLLDTTSVALPLPNEDHDHLDGLLDDLDDQFAALRNDPDAHAALSWYRNLNRYIASTLEHLHAEETTVLPVLWAERSDAELVECRNAFLAATPPHILQTTMSLFSRALPSATVRPPAPM